jgi:hypothetical protein
MAKRYIQNVRDLRLRQEAPDVPATARIAELVALEQFMQTTKLRGSEALLAFYTRKPVEPIASPEGSPSHPDISDVFQDENPDISPVSIEPTHEWGNRLGF